MVYLWDSKVKEDEKISRCALGEHAIGNIATVIVGERSDSDLVYLGCRMAKAAKRKVHLLHVIQVPRVLPLKSILAYESERANQLLNSAMAIAHSTGCETIPQVVQTRDVGSAIVDEV